ncbi:hypothetical protein, partial [Pseudoalteromonas aurantia]|uniref:hypothetical protein n=1 Tax=Pseudoalteromonas aurantia TaxID=43654 RepID=UPI001BB15388
THDLTLASCSAGKCTALPSPNGTLILFFSAKRYLIFSNADQNSCIRIRNSVVLLPNFDLNPSSTPWFFIGSQSPNMLFLVA